MRNDMYHVKRAFPPGRAALGTETRSPIPSTKSLDGFQFRDYKPHTNSTSGQCYGFSPYNSTKTPSPSSSSKSNSSMSRVFLRAISGDCVYENANPIYESTYSKQESDMNYYYDSDPGEGRRRQKAPRRATSLEHRETSIRRRTLSETLIDEHDTDNESGALSLSDSEDEDMDMSGCYNDLIVDVKNDEHVTKFVRELTNGNVTLVWHPSKCQKNDSGSPVCVQAWFEMGSRLRDKVIQPKFMWWAAYQPDITRKKLSISTHTPESVELLNIVRVLKPSHIDREHHPFAKQRNSFTLQSNTNEVYLFEAFSEKERDRFVQGLKLVVARLASKIIVGDENVFDEFFTPWGQSISPNGLSDNAVSTDTESCQESLDSFDDEGDDLFFKTEGKEIFRASPVFNK